jgi:hypothetical protein
MEGSVVSHSVHVETSYDEWWLKLAMWFDAQGSFKKSLM